MTTESKKPSEILRPPYEATRPYPTKKFTAYSDARYAIDDSHHSRLTALEAAMATLTPPKPAAEDEVVFKGIGDIVYAVVGDKYCVCFSDGTFSEWWTTEGAALSRTIPRTEAEALRPAIRERFPVKGAVTERKCVVCGIRPVRTGTVFRCKECFEAAKWLAGNDPDISGATTSGLVVKAAKSVDDEAREFYCQRHEGVRLRDVADWMVRDMIDFANQRTAAVERERDEWKAKFEKLEARWNTDHAAVYTKLSTVRSERDAAMAKVAELANTGERFNMEAWNILRHEYGERFRIDDSDASSWAAKMRRFLAASDAHIAAMRRAGKRSV